MTKRQTTIITALSILAFILALMVSSRLWFRLDLTKSKAYTISNVSRSLHNDIPDYVNITYFISDRLRSVIPAPGEIEDMLREYAAYSKGKIRVTVRDPLKANLQISVEELGIQPRQIQNVERDQASLTTVYSGILIEYLDRMDILPWVISTATLEYDLTSRIRSMVLNTERRIGVIVGDSFRQWRNDFGFLAMMLSESGYQVRPIEPGDEIPDNLPALFVLGGVEDLDYPALYRIDRFIQLGGKVFFAVKGVYVDTITGSVEARHLEDKGLLDMLASYGVIVRRELALDRNALTLQYQTRLPSGAIQYRIIRYPFWIGVSAENGNKDHPVSTGFSALDMYWPSPLELVPPANIEAQTILQSTEQAWSMIDSFYTNPEITYLFEKDAAQTRGTKIFAASLAGVFPSFFRGAQLPELEDWELPEIPVNAKASRIIVAGDVDFSTNMMNMTGANYNLDFLLRCADWLASDDDIIGIRNREPHIGRLDKIIDEDKKEAAMRSTRIINVFVIPLLVIAAGFVLAWRRSARSRKQEIQ